MEPRGAPGDASGDNPEAVGQIEEESFGKESLLKLVSPELLCLSRYWLAALKDHALLSLPGGRFTNLPPEVVLRGLFIEVYSWPCSHLFGVRVNRFNMLHFI